MRMHSGASTFIVTSRLSKVKIQNFALLMYSGASTFVVTSRLTKTALLSITFAVPLYFVSREMLQEY